MTFLVSLLFSFLSFNTSAMMPNDERLAPTASLINAAGADFVFLTEEYTGQMSSMLVPPYPYALKARSHLDETERFYSRYPIVDIKETGTLTEVERSDSWVHRVRVLVGESDTLSIYCCHLPHDLEDRVSIARAILEDISLVGGKAVVGGDMNSLSLSEPIMLFFGAGLRDSWLEKGRGSGATFHGLPIGLRIDYIFHTPDLELRSVRRISGSSISDHDALFADFSIK